MSPLRSVPGTDAMSSHPQLRSHAATAHLRSALSGDAPTGAATAGTPQEVANHIAEGKFTEVLGSVDAGARESVGNWALGALDTSMHWTYFWVGLLCAVTVPVLAAFLKDRPGSEPKLPPPPPPSPGSDSDDLPVGELTRS